MTFKIGTQAVFTSSDQSYTSTSSSTLLTQFQALNNNDTSRLGNFDLAHLFTGKTLKNGVGGTAYKGVLCKSASYSYGLSALSGSSIINFITTAHELGHNFSASHDYGDDNDGPNDRAYEGHIMNAFASPLNTTFSEYTVNEINTHLDTYNSCLANRDGGNGGDDGGDDDGDGSSGDLAVDLSVSSRGKSGKKLNVSTTISLTNGSAPCTGVLYGANKKNQLSNATDLASASKVTALTSFDITPGESVELSGKVKNGSESGKKKDYLQVEITCSGDSTSGESAIQKISSHWKKSKKLFNKLSSGLQ